MLELKKSYYQIPIIGIILTIISAVFSYRLHLNTLVLEKCDFTGGTTFFLKSIVVINICILAIDLYLVIKKKENGFPYKLNIIFSIGFFILTIICIISFISIRNAEEEVAVEFANRISEINNDIKNANRRKINEDSINKLFEYQSDEFYDFKMHISSEVESTNSIIERYISVGTPFFAGNRYVYEREYYSLIVRFIILEFILCLWFAYHIKDEYIEKNTKLSN